MAASGKTQQPETQNALVLGKDGQRIVLSLDGTIFMWDGKSYKDGEPDKKKWRPAGISFLLVVLTQYAKDNGWEVMYG